MGELKKGVVNLETALEKVPLKDIGLVAISNTIQRSFSIPLGLLAQCGPLWRLTGTAAYWSFGNEERRKWCMNMSMEVFQRWRQLVYKIDVTKKPVNRSVDLAAVQYVATHIIDHPGELFAIRVSKQSKWHHVSCRTLENSFGHFKDMDFLDLMATSDPNAPVHKALWCGLLQMHCCGSLWRSSNLLWS